MRSALFLSVLSCALSMLLSAVRSGVPMARGISWLLQAVQTVLCFGLPAYLGLFVLDGDQSHLVLRRALGAPHILHLSLLGALTIAPMTLMCDIQAGLLALFLPAGQAGESALSAALFLPALLSSALLAPVCEELFFRGYLTGAMMRYGRRNAILASSMLFALAHGIDVMLVPRALFGALLALLMLRTGTLLAPMAVHALYNLAVIFVSYLGLDGLFSGLGLLSCALRVGLCALWVGVLRRVWKLPPMRRDAAFGGGFKKREIALAATAGALLAAAAIMAGVMGL